MPRAESTNELIDLCCDPVTHANAVNGANRAALEGFCGPSMGQAINNACATLYAEGWT